MSIIENRGQTEDERIHILRRSLSSETLLTKNGLFGLHANAYRKKDIQLLFRPLFSTKKCIFCEKVLLTQQHISSA